MNLEVNVHIFTHVSNSWPCLRTLRHTQLIYILLTTLVPLGILTLGVFHRGSNPAGFHQSWEWRFSNRSEIE